MKVIFLGFEGISSSWVSKEFRVIPEMELLPLERSPNGLTNSAVKLR